MIGFLKRWFVTKNEVDSIEKRLDDLAYGIQQMHRKLILQQDVDVEHWRPKGYILNGGKPVNGTHALSVDVTNKPMIAKLSPDAKKAYDAWRAKGVSPLDVVTPKVLPRHIANAKVMVGKVGGHAEVRKLVKEGKLHAFIQAGPVDISGRIYQGGKLTLYNSGLKMPSNAKRYTMVLHSTKETKEVTQYFRSVGIPVKEEHK